MDTLNQAIDRLTEQTGFKVRIVNDGKTAKRPDARIEVAVGKDVYKWVVEVKNELTAHFLAQVGDVKKELGARNPLLIVTGFTNPRVREQLRDQGIDFLDTAGNALLRQGQLFVMLGGNQRIMEPEKLKNRAFTNTGLKVLFYFLHDPANVNLTIREIADTTDTALDTVHKTINALLRMKYLLKVNKKEYRITNTKELMERWIQDYDLKLKNKLFIGAFRFARKEDELNWRNLALDKKDTVWGGEPAGTILTEYLRPEIFTIYTTCTKNDLAKKYKLLPDSRGNVMVYDKFWRFTGHEQMTVPAILAYAELIATGDDRCIETAKMIYKDLLANRYQ